MALRIAARPTFRATVKAYVPTEAGEIEEQTFKVVYRLASDSKAPLGTPEEQDAFMRDIVLRIEDLADENGAPLAYDDAVREQVFALPWAQTAILRGYFESLVPARLGN